jgi:hypothetical protein
MRASSVHLGALAASPLRNRTLPCFHSGGDSYCDQEVTDGNHFDFCDLLTFCWWRHWNSTASCAVTACGIDLQSSWTEPNPNSFIYNPAFTDWRAYIKVNNIYYRKTEFALISLKPTEHYRNFHSALLFLSYKFAYTSDVCVKQTNKSN